MTVQGAKRLVMFGFCKPQHKEKYAGKKPRDVDKEFSKLDPAQKEQKLQDFEKEADTDELEIAKDQMLTVDYPKPINRYYVVYETFHESIEPIYYTSLSLLKDGLGFPIINKVNDMFTAAEHSSYYGAAGQRLGLAQDRVAQYLATIGKMVKDLFQLVRELRWIDERLRYYKNAVDDKLFGDEIVLKGLWVDLVDGVVGGQRTTANLFLMAQQLQFSTLPDLFFSIHPQTVEDVEKIVEQKAGGFNTSVKNALIRKLKQYLAWRDSTYQEMKTRRKFTIDYLRQHFTVIKMYMTWVKPYLKHVHKLTGSMENINRPELISAFESSMIDIEILAQKIPEKNKNYYACILMTFEYRTRPALSYAQEGGYHRGPIHVGETRITWRSYAWTQKDIDRYLAMKDYEDLELLTSLDQSLKDAMDTLGADLVEFLEEQYTGIQREHAKQLQELMVKQGLTLEQAQKVLNIQEQKPTQKQESILQPFIDVGKGFKDFLDMLKPRTSARKTSTAQAHASTAEKDAAGKMAQSMLWTHYKTFKKSNGMLTW